MKKIFIATAAALTTLVACQKNELAAPATDPILYATIEETDATKTYMDASNNIRWSKGDQVVAFMKTSLGLSYQIKDEYVGKTSGYFSQISSGSSSDLGAGTEWDHNVVYYPYSSTIEAAKSGSNYVLDVVLPSEQTYAAESFGNGSMAMVAVSENNNITFKNILGGMKLQLKGTQKIASITLQGKNNEKFSGAAVVTAYAGETKPAITMSDGASTSVTLDCGSGVQLNESSATDFIIALPPVVFTKGFTVTITDTESNTYTVGTDKGNEVLRSSLLVMPAVSLESGQGSEPREGDYVDEYGINHGQGVEIDGVIWAPVNCGYHKDDFKFGKLYQWGRKYGQGYYGSLYDPDMNYIEDYYDAGWRVIESAPVSLEAAQSEGNEGIFYKSTKEYNYNWFESSDYNLWNSGTEENPVKTEYDPCPKGWRVPTLTELSELTDNFTLTTDDIGRTGYTFEGVNPVTSEVSQLFFPYSGYSPSNGYTSNNRGGRGYYWSSNLNDVYADYLIFHSETTSLTAYNRAHGFSVRCVLDDSELIPVSDLTIDKSSLSIYLGTNSNLYAIITPSNANHQSAYWSSSDTSVATVDQNGSVTAVSPGTVTITAMAGMKTAICEVTVSEETAHSDDYIDEYGINHGQGVEIDGVVWAPVNCGYHKDDFKFGKLYQWGRKYGQGYSGNLYDVNGNDIGTYSDATVPTIVSGPVDLAAVQSKGHENIFYTYNSSPYDWLSPQNDELWNSGTESDPVKTENDPCPDGWRVPTYVELDELRRNRSSWTSEDGQLGYWFSGASSYTENVPQVFFPAAGCRYYDGNTYNRGNNGYYWSSSPSNDRAYYLDFASSGVNMPNGGRRAPGFSVRCVQE